VAIPEMPAEVFWFEPAADYWQQWNSELLSIEA